MGDDERRDAFVRDAFARMQRWAKTNHLDLGLREPYAGDVPAPIAAMYRVHDGQNGTSLFEIYDFLPAEEAAEAKRFMDGMAEEDDWDADWWSPHWFPFGDDRSGQFLVVDQQTGAVLEYVHDDVDRPCWSNSLESFLADFADSLENGERVVSADRYRFIVRANKAFDPVDARLLPGRGRSLLAVIAMFLGAKGHAVVYAALLPGPVSLRWWLPLMMTPALVVWLARARQRSESERITVAQRRQWAIFGMTASVGQFVVAAGAAALLVGGVTPRFDSVGQATAMIAVVAAGALLEIDASRRVLKFFSGFSR